LGCGIRAHKSAGFGHATEKIACPIPAVAILLITRIPINLRQIENQGIIKDCEALSPAILKSFG